MSLRYTGEATMDEPALRDVERWKDKIEVRLDNRQVFFLFFGSAMVACMLFVLGVIVGKRLESRGRAEAPVIEDPLAALDRFSAPASATPAGATLAFPRALLNNAPLKGEHLTARPTLTAVLPVVPRKATERTSEKATDRTTDKAEKAADRVAAAAPVEAPVARHESTPRKLALVESPAAPVKKTGAVDGQAASLANGQAASPAMKKLEKTSLLPHPVAAAAAPPVSKPAPLLSPAAPKGPALTAKPVAAARPVPAAKPVAVPVKTPPAAPAHAAGKGNFLLQLSSFQDRAEADAFARRFSGQNAYVVASEVPGKGLWYRVRVGSYGTMKDAAAAKTAFEREHGVIAYVAGTGPAQ
jgi:DedD protein